MTGSEWIVLLAWLVVGGDNLRRAWTGTGHTERDGLARPIAGAVLVAGLAVASWNLERVTDRWLTSPGLAILGVTAALLGAALHLHARRTLGAAWATRVQPPGGEQPIITGAYRRIRHPLYAAIRLLAVAVVLVHPSAATACLVVGLWIGTGLKARAEERALIDTFADAYRTYAERTPRFLPRPLRTG